MCGIAGIVYSDPHQKVEKEILSSMTNVLSHRGPDDSGLFLDQEAGLGHRRLSVIDLDAGHQPLSDETGQVWVTFNGEIYNFEEIRRNLESSGCHFKTRTDTEVLAQVYRTKGVDCLNDLRGMFAFAIWDKSKRRLFLARDQIGKKPVYYYYKNGVFLFASELKSFLKYPNLSLQIEPSAVKEFLIYQYIASPKTIYREIFKLPPAHYLIFENGKISIQNYWNLDFQKKRQENKEILLLQGMQGLLESVQLRLKSDVPLGIFLSGGLDSSTIAALATQGTLHQIKTFSVSFSQNSHDESSYARKVANHLGTEHHEVKLGPDIVSSLEKWAWHFDEPFGDASALPTYWMAGEAKKFVTVILSGDGGDECFGGYHRYTQKLLWDRLKKLLSWSLNWTDEKSSSEWPTERFQRLFYESSKRINLPEDEQYDGWMRIYQDPLLSKIWGESLKNMYMPALNKTDSSLDSLDAMLKSDFQRYLPDCLMTKVDRASMAHGLEVRSPFLDSVFVEFCAQLPSDLKIKDFRKKLFLKKMMGAGLPSSIVHRPKKGFTVPLNQWFRGELKSFAQEVLLDSKTLQRGYVHPEAIKRLLEDHISEKDNHGHRLWLLIVLELWHRTFWDT